jgi:hypothetical protein
MLLHMKKYVPNEGISVQCFIVWVRMIWRLPLQSLQQVVSCIATPNVVQAWRT